MPLYSVSNSDRDELQKEPNLFECFEQMHKKNDGMFVDERSKRVAEEIQARHDAATQEAEGSIESPNIDMSQLYVDVVGGLKALQISQAYRLVPKWHTLPRHGQPRPQSPYPPPTSLTEQ
nr:uncharacterized protein LOC109157302 isoform X1 [Ipomoea trifida]